MKDLSNYECEGQLSLFDIIPPEEKYLEEVVLRGTGFTGGKQRVLKLYESDIPTKERADRIKNEYGIGGERHPLHGYGYHGYDTSATGINIEYRDALGDHEKLYSWSDVEKTIHRLIKAGIYYTTNDMRRNR